ITDQTPASTSSNPQEVTSTLPIAPLLPLVSKPPQDSSEQAEPVFKNDAVFLSANSRTGPHTSPSANSTSMPSSTRPHHGLLSSSSSSALTDTTSCASSIMTKGNPASLLSFSDTTSDAGDDSAAPANTNAPRNPFLAGSLLQQRAEAERQEVENMRLQMKKREQAGVLGARNNSDMALFSTTMTGGHGRGPSASGSTVSASSTATSPKFGGPGTLLDKHVLERAKSAGSGLLRPSNPNSPGSTLSRARSKSRGSTDSRSILSRPVSPHSPGSMYSLHSSPGTPQKPTGPLVQFEHDDVPIQPGLLLDRGMSVRKGSSDGSPNGHQSGPRSPGYPGSAGSRSPGSTIMPSVGQTQYQTHGPSQGQSPYANRSRMKPLIDIGNVNTKNDMFGPGLLSNAMSSTALKSSKSSARNGKPLLDLTAKEITLLRSTWMPLLNRVFFPAWKRKPPIRRHGLSPQLQTPASSLQISPPNLCRSRTQARANGSYARIKGSRKGCISFSGIPDHSAVSRAELARTLIPMSKRAYASSTTFTDLYNVFRYILETRTHRTRGRGNQLGNFDHINHQCSSSAPCRISASPSTRTHGRFQLFAGEANSMGSATVSASESKMMYSTRSISYGSPLPSRVQSFDPTSRRGLTAANRSIIPSRTFSLHQSGRTIDDITDTRLIGEPAPATPAKSHSITQSSSSTPVFIKNWLSTQLTGICDLYQDREYQKALTLINQVRTHENMDLIPNCDSHIYSAKVIRWRLQDLGLVEYCCRLAMACDSGAETHEVVELLQYMNATLDPIAEHDKQLRASLKTAFLQPLDPILDRALVQLNSLWLRYLPENEKGGTHDVDLPTNLSHVRLSLATSAAPFLRAIIDRQLFASATTSSTSAQTLSGAIEVQTHDPREMVLKVFLTLKDQHSTAQWIKIWNKVDPKDWANRWTQLDIKRDLTSEFIHSDRPDWIMDLFRLHHTTAGSSHRWLMDLLATIVRSQAELGANVEPKSGEIISLTRLLKLYDLDSATFQLKKDFYGESWKRRDHTHSWLEGLQDPEITAFVDRATIEGLLWREMGMAGILSGHMLPEDVLASVEPGIARTITKSTPFSTTKPRCGEISESGASSYEDTLTQYLYEKTVNVSDTSLLGSSPASRKEKAASLKAADMLRSAIQEMMTLSAPSTQDQLTQAVQSYGHLLNDVARRIALRIGHLGCISQVEEIRFRSLYPKEEGSSSQLPISLPFVAQPPSLDKEKRFAESSLKSLLARMCATSLIPEDSSKTRWIGQLSEWFKSTAGSSLQTRAMMEYVAQGDSMTPWSWAYTQALWTLVREQEMDLAIGLHSHTYKLGDTSPTPFKNSHIQGGTVDHSALVPTASDLGKFVHAILVSDDGTRRLEQAQWVVDQHLDKRMLAKSLSPKQKIRRVVDVQLTTELAGAWARRANFIAVRKIVQIMHSNSIQPNMIFYNTLLKAMLDLTPSPRPGRRTMAFGKQNGMRELGRELLIKEMLQNNTLATIPEGSGSSLHRKSYPLHDGYQLFRELAFPELAQGQLPQLAQNPDPLLLLKDLILKSIVRADERDPKDGGFKPDAFTYSILLSAFARRGGIESISEIYSKMSIAGVKPDKAICTILASAFAKKGDFKSLRRIISEARSQNIVPGNYLTNIVLNGLVETNAPLSAIRDTLNAVISLQNPDRKSRKSTEAGTPPVLAQGQEQESHPWALQPFRGQSLITSLSLSEDMVDVVTFTTLIKLYTNQNDLQSAHEVLLAMVQRGIAPNPVTFVQLLSVCIRVQDAQAGLSIVKLMRTYGARQGLDAKTWKGLLRTALHQESFTTFLNSRKHSLSRARQSSQVVESQLNDGTVKDQMVPTEDSSPVISVLKELADAVNELGVLQPRPSFDYGMTSLDEPEKSKQDGGMPVSRKYLLDVFSSSWIRAPKPKLTKEQQEITGKAKYPELKGKNGLLRRLLDHLLRDNEFSGKRVEHYEFSKTRASNSRKGQVKNPQVESMTEIMLSEEQENTEERCRQAVWLLRLFEDSGIELGTRWKADVVGQKIQRLTGWESSIIQEMIRGHQTKTTKQQHE
ncbi:hypothetical protein BGW38_005162, partial [Lunasporangiospora selenospora]